jgi:formylglycine-generating enzyme required for sulfatase activity
MDGNAQEWTDSWYRAYENNYTKDKKYGTQYKVIRGGAWFTTRKEARVTDRKIGGIPDLYTDRIAGFRCVRNAAPGDRK